MTAAYTAEANQNTAPRQTLSLLARLLRHLLLAACRLASLFSSLVVITRAYYTYPPSFPPSSSLYPPPHPPPHHTLCSGISHASQSRPYAHQSQTREIPSLPAGPTPLSLHCPPTCLSVPLQLIVYSSLQNTTLCVFRLREENKRLVYGYVGKGRTRGLWQKNRTTEVLSLRLHMPTCTCYLCSRRTRWHTHHEIRVIVTLLLVTNLATSVLSDSNGRPCTKKF